MDEDYYIKLINNSFLTTLLLINENQEWVADSVIDDVVKDQLNIYLPVSILE
jgi:hypothetical protein